MNTTLSPHLISTDPPTCNTLSKTLLPTVVSFYVRGNGTTTSDVMPSKRKRTFEPSSAHQSSKKQATSCQTIRISGSPIFEVYGDSTRDGNNNDHCQSGKSTTDIFDQMLLFAELSGQSFKTISDKDIFAKLNEAVESLLHCLLPVPSGSQRAIDADFSKEDNIDSSCTEKGKRRTDGTNFSSSLVSEADIMRLLLTWSIKSILHNEANQFGQSSLSTTPDSASTSLPVQNLCWKTMHTCLKYYLSSNEQNSCGSFLTLSTVQKIVPIALKVALDSQAVKEEEHDERNIRPSFEPGMPLLARESFCYFMDNLYQPSFDVLCHSLLPILANARNFQQEGEDVKDIGPDSHGNTKIASWLIVTKSILRLLLCRLNNANPKRSFQLLLRPEIFLPLATVYHRTKSLFLQSGICIEESLPDQVLHQFSMFVRDAFFSLDHHMDGYRSLQVQIPTRIWGPTNDKKDLPSATQAAKKACASDDGIADSGSIHCYQDRLLTTLETFIQQHDAEDINVDSNIESRVAVANFSSFLLDTFLQQTSTLQKQQQKSKQKIVKKIKLNNKISHLQFRLVAAVTGYLLNGLVRSRDSLQKSNNSKFLVVSAENLELLLTYNVYQPSVDNSEEKMFLDAVAKAVVAAMVRRQDETNTVADKQDFCLTGEERQYAFGILSVLMRLDHTTLHHKLIPILSRCLTFKEVVSPDTAATLNNDGMCSIFLTHVIATYGRLRQLDYFYKCCNAALMTLVQEKDAERLHGLHAFARDGVITSHLQQAIQESPIQQVNKIFVDMNDTIISMTRMISPLETKVAALSTATKLLIGLLRNVRVNSNTQKNIFALVVEIMRGSIQEMSDRKQEPNGKPSGIFLNALSLCSWTLDAKNRIKFWAGKEKLGQSLDDDCSIPLSILLFLDDAVDNQINLDNSTMDDHSVQEEIRLFACQRIRQLDAEIVEKQRIAFATDAEEYDIEDEVSQARKLSTFVLRGGLSNSEMMYRADASYASWLALMETVQTWAPHVDTVYADLFLGHLFRVLSTTVRASSCKRTDVLFLLNDATFYEIPVISRRLGINAVSFVSEKITEVLKCYTKTPPNLLRIAKPVLNQEWESIPLKEVNCLYSDLVTMQLWPNSATQAVDLLRECLSVLDTVVLGQIPVWVHCEDSDKVLASLLRIDAVVCAALAQNVTSLVSNESSRFLCVIRLTTARVIEALAKQTDVVFLGPQQDSLWELVSHVLQNTSKAIDSIRNEKERRKIVASFSLFLSSAIKLSISINEVFPRKAIGILEAAFSSDGVASLDSHRIVLTACTSAFLKTIRCFPSDLQGAQAVFWTTKKCIWSIAQTTVFHQYCLGSLIWDLSVDLISEGLRLSSTYGDARSALYVSLEDTFVGEIVALLEKNLPSGASRSIAYLASCLGQCNPCKHVRSEIINGLFCRLTMGNMVYKTPLRVLVKRMEPAELEEFLEDLTTKQMTDSVSTITSVKLFHALLEMPKNPGQTDVMANYSTVFLSACLQIFVQGTMEASPDGDSVMAASSLIVEIASQKDVATIRERDIALILSGVCGTLRTSDTFVENEDMVGYQTKAYEACYFLVSFFLQRFSRQVQSCVPSLLALLISMLQFVLYAPLQERAIRNCGQKFCRVCELLLPHGEVYKKHILCLLVQFVKGLGGVTDVNRKKSLLNGIYCLLDIIQEHEAKQLNSMLDEIGRALLLAIHQGYKKHAYKGQ